MSPHTRMAWASDVEQLLPMMREFRTRAGKPWSEYQTRAALALLLRHPEHGCAWVVRDGPRIAGYAVVTFAFSLEYGGRIALLDELFIAPEFRRRGLGRLALDTAEAYCTSRDVHALFAEVPPAMRDYRPALRDLGYSELGRPLINKAVAPPWLAGQEEAESAGDVR